MGFRGSGVWGLGFRGSGVWGVGFWVWGLGFWVWGFGFGVLGLRLRGVWGFRRFVEIVWGFYRVPITFGQIFSRHALTEAFVFDLKFTFCFL